MQLRENNTSKLRSKSTSNDLKRKNASQAASSPTLRENSSPAKLCPSRTKTPDHQRLSVNSHMKETLIQSLEDVARDVVKTGTTGIEKLQTIMTEAKEKVSAIKVGVRYHSCKQAGSPRGYATAACHVLASGDVWPRDMRRWGPGSCEARRDDGHENPPRTNATMGGGTLWSYSAEVTTWFVVNNAIGGTVALV